MFGKKKTNQKVIKKVEETVSQESEEIIKKEKTEVENKKTSTDKKINKKSKSTKITQSLADFLY